jgi:hypothetical protein
MLCSKLPKTYSFFNLLVLLIAITACNDKPSDGAPAPQDPGDLTVTPGSMQITILSPATDGTSLSSYSVISGDCGIPGNPIEVSGAGITLLSVCQNDYSWSAPISAVTQPEGAVQYTVKLKDKLLTAESPAVMRSFIKRDGICLDSVNRGKVFANFESADGTATPYKICTPTQFSNIRFYPSKKFVLSQDIDFGDITIFPIAVAFTGELDGQGFMMKDFTIKDIGGTGTSVGLFRYVQGATIKNLNIKNAIVDSTQRIGLLAGDWRGGGLIENVKVQGSVKGITMVGGLIGLGNTAFSLTLRNVKTDVTVTANDYTGGVIGYINTTNGSFNIENSDFRANVSGNSWTGGIAGHVMEDDTTFTNVTHRGAILSLTDKVGGLVGELNGGTLINVSHTGSVGTIKNNGDNFVGGLIGQTTKPVAINGASVVSTISSGGSYTGGLVGRFYSGSITNAISRVTMNVQDTQFLAPQKFAGGLVGSTNLDTTIADSHAVVTMNTKAYYVGGLVGNMNGANSSIQRSWTTGIINGKVSNVGGLVGNFTGSSISQSFSRANISITGPTPNAYIGGLVGMANNSAATFTRLYNSGNISILDGTPDMVGGIFGYVKGLSVKQAYASGSIAGARSKVGGIAGYLAAPISESFFNGTIAATFRYVGGIAGIALQSVMTDNFVQSSLIQGSGEVGGIAGWLVEGNGAQISRSYFTGNIKKNETSTLDDSTFGAMAGIMDANATLSGSYFESTSTFVRNTDSQPIVINTLGQSLTTASMRNQSSFSGYNFTSSPTLHNWLMPTTGFKLPFKSSDFLFPIHDWLTDANQGFSLPVTYTDDPINQPQPEFYDHLQNILSTFSQGAFDIITSNSAPTTITQGQLQMSFVSPSADGASIATQYLIYGECGIPGGKISLSGSFIVNTICQSNYRWSAIIDATSKPAGNLTVSAKLYNLAQTSSSTSIVRIFNKNSSICSDSAAIKGFFANSHLEANGTSIPYKICHVGHFKNIAYSPNSSFELANDIDFGSNTFDPILVPFKGILDGKNFTIRNLNVNKATGVSVGMFAAAQNATLKNVNIEKFSVVGNERVGVFSGDWRGTGVIENVTLKTGSVNAITTSGILSGLANTSSAIQINGLTIKDVTLTANNNVGGIFGYISSIDGSFNAQNINITNLIVNGLGNVGGLVGISLQPNMSISNVAATDLNVTGLAEKIGGLLGNIDSASLSNVNVTGEINAPKDAVEIFVGGLVGEATKGLTLNTVRWTGPISSGSDNVGGIAGKVTNLTATNMISSGLITIIDDRYNSVRKHIGGLVGFTQGETSTVQNSSSTMTINAQAQFTGGLFGRFEGEFSTIKNSNFSGVINARTSYVGGLAGLFDGSDLWDSYNTGAVNVTNPTPNANIGGLLGYANSKTANYKRLRSSGNVTITNGSADYVGGLVGFFRAGTIEDSSSTGNVSGGRIANGGFIGMLRGSVDRCYSTGNVTASGRQNGGLVGYLNLTGYIRDSFSTGNVTSADETGGLVGHLNTTHGQIAISSSYAFGQVNKDPSSTALDTNFGPIYGTMAAAGQADASSLYYLTAKYNPLHNSIGTAVANGTSSQQGSYAGLNFISTPGWRIPNAATNVPGFGTNFPYPILDWIGAGTSNSDYEVSGTIAGLQFSSLSLSLNGGEEVVSINAPNSTFSFARRFEPSQTYAITISQQPSSPAITCSIANGTGTMGQADVTNVVITCPTFQSMALAASAVMASGTGQAITVNGTLNNSIVVDLTAFASLNSSNTTNFTLIGSNLLATSVGSTTLSSNFLSLGATKAISSITNPAAPTGPLWQGTSPSAVPGLVAQWTKSTTLSIASQVINYYANGTCTGSPVSTKNLTSSAVTDSFTGTDALTYSFKVTAVDSNTLTSPSACSSAMLVTLPTPSPINSLAASQIWVNGASPVTSPIYSWVNPASISGLEFSLGNSVGGTQVLNWAPTGVITSYTISNLTTLTNCIPYYASVRAVNQYGKKSSVVSHATGFKWDNGAPSSPGSIVTSGIASKSVSTMATWGASSDNCQLNSYEMAIGTTPGATDISGGWKNIGNTTTYQVTAGSGGFNAFTLTASTDYYTSVRAKDEAGNYSALMTSSAWQLPSSELAKVFWYDAADRTSIKDPTSKTPDDPGFSNKVRTWQNISSAPSMDAFSAGTTNDPGFDSNKNYVTFSGTNQYLKIPSSTAFDNSTATFKNIFVSFQTSVDLTTRQVIYEQGTSAKGINIYLLNGLLYCGFWNTTNGGDGAQAMLYNTSATSLAPNTIYHAAVVLDYTNYTTATGPNGSVKCYLNNSQMGSTLSTTSRLYAQSGSAALGANFTGTRFHNSTVSNTGDYFRGQILEALMFAAHPNESIVLSTLNSLMAKWSSGELSSPGNLALVNNSTLTKAATANWTPISSSYFQTSHYEVAIGTAADTTDILYWTNVGNVTAYTAENGIDGVSLNLLYGQDYFFMVKAIDGYGNESSVALSDVWRLLPPGSTTLAGTFLSLDASSFSTVLDANGIDAEQVNFANVVGTWNNKINSLVNNFTQTSAASRPTFNKSLKSVIFNRTSNFLSSPAETNMGNSTVTAKVLTLVFSTNTDVTTTQFLFELGARSTRGLSVYIGAGQVYCLFHQNSNGGDGAQAPIWLNSPVMASTSYVVSLYLDYSNYTNSSGPNGNIGCVVNGVSLGTVATTSRWYASTDPAYIGYRNSARWHNSNSNGAGNYFGGEIHEVQMTNTWPTGGVSDVQDLHNNLMQKW